MKAGPELNALVAEKVMGWTVCRDKNCEGCEADIYLVEDGCWESKRDDTNFSSDIAAAWQVVEKLVPPTRKGPWLEITATDGYASEGPYICEYAWWADHKQHRVRADADTAPLAICLAALKARRKESSHDPAQHRQQSIFGRDDVGHLLDRRSLSNRRGVSMIRRSEEIRRLVKDKVNEMSFVPDLFYDFEYILDRLDRIEKVAQVILSGYDNCDDTEEDWIELRAALEDGE